MTPERWQEARNICDAVLDRAPEERGAMLDELCGDDEGLRRDVELMIADACSEDSVAAATSPTPATVRFPNVSAAALEPAIWQPDAIGGFRIVRVVGEGGMGVVYEALQQEPSRTVALKVIRPGLASREVLRRFRQEAHALGRLQHPGIAQIYETGTAESAFGPQPYLAMEFIRGQSLRAYVDQHRPSVHARLELVARIADAVHHAHQRGLIHRDLKPSNILIDDTGQPKVLDFGVARLTDSDVQVTQQTDLGQLVGTLAYMSPEQVLANPLELDIRSDVYALGVILYELLAGRLPYTISTQIHEAVRTIQHEEPQRLSSISRGYRGDLETIAAKALEKDKTRRYGSAAALAADIRRYLHNEPISARPASATYQLRKFARRHRVLVTAAGAVVVALAAGIVATAREAIRARQAEQRAVEAQTIADAVNEFLQNDLLSQASANRQAGPQTRPDPDLRVRTALDRAAANIEQRFTGQPLVEAAIRQTIGRTYRELGLLDEAQRHLEKSYELRREKLDEANASLLETMDDLAWVYVLRGKFPQAEQLVLRVVDTRRRTLGEEHHETLLATVSLGYLYLNQGDFQKAEPVLVKTLEIRRRVSGSDHLATATVMTNLAQVYHNLGKLEEAEPLYDEALAVRRRHSGTEHPDTLTVMNNLATVYMSQGRYDAAETLLEETTAIRRRVLGEEHPSTLSATDNLAQTRLRLGKAEEARSMFEHVLQMRRKVLGPEHPGTLVTINNVTLVLGFQGKFAEGAALLSDLLEVRRRISGPEHPETLTVAANLGVMYGRLGRFDEATSLLTRTEATRSRLFGAEHPQTQGDREQLARVYQLEGKYTASEALFRRLLETRRRTRGDTHDDTLRTAWQLGASLLKQRRFAEARDILRETLDAYTARTPDAWSRFLCESLLGESLAGLGNHADAEPLLRSGIDGLLQRRRLIPGGGDSMIADARKALDEATRARGKPVPAGGSSK
jgi:tetratricopeptide (TPR) repeat protein/tRNA A-37 threonylcarbamoyl transferase component Bud32